MMLDNIKGLIKIKEEINDIKERTDYHSSTVKELTKGMQSFKEEFSTVKEEMNELKKSQKELMEEMKANLGIFNNLRQDLGKEIYDFKMLKSKLQQKVLDKFEEELKKELKVNVETLRNEMQDYEQVKGSVKEMLKKVELTKQEMDKWMDISTEIKKADFELHKFAQQLAQADSEKLHLMKKIDTLERLVSKMRRSQQVTR